MKKIYALLILFFCFTDSFANHTKGGWAYYEYLGQGIQDPTKLRYRVGIKFYVICFTSVPDPSFDLTIFDAANSNIVTTVFVVPSTDDNIQNCQTQTCYPCINNIPQNCYNVRTYEGIVELAPSPNGYIVSQQRCCRINGISNIQPPSTAVGATYTVRIPGFNQTVPNAHVNNSPVFNFNDTTIVCANNQFSIDFSAIDADSLSYSLCAAYDGGSQATPLPAPSAPPPFSTIPYLFPFSGTQPLGNQVTIDPATGIVSGIAPSAGEYVVTVCVFEYRNGIMFAESRKELHLKVQPCNPVVATLDPTFLTCGDLTLSFFNQTDGPAIQNWFWTFGDPATGSNDTSLLQFPTHTFSTAGVYTVKLIVNYGLPCIDSSEQQVSVYPGFFPGFQSSSPYCQGVPVQFNDTTRTNFGTVSSWYWNFGDPATLADTSRSQNPVYTYSNPGTYTIKLISANSLGCRDSIEHQITILPLPVLNLLSLDTTYCRLDSLQLNATGTGNFSWTPSTNMIGANTATPTVFPSTPTQYIVTLENQGCLSRDTLNLNPVNDVTNAITAIPAAICEGDTLTLTGSSNKTSHLSWQWNPPTRTATPNAQSTLAWPDVNTTYTLQTRWGQHCIANSSVNIPVTPLAIPNAGPDAYYCNGQTPVQLSASGGNSYSWTPAAGLSNPNIANPVATPTVTTDYIVQVGVTGCSKTRPDTVRVTVREKPVLNPTNDTLICVRDTLQLNVGNTNGTALWTPNYMINNTSALNPLVSPDVPTTYRVRFTDSFGCFTDDSIKVDVKAVVSLSLQDDTTICEGSSITLQGTSDGLLYSWTPAATLSNPDILNPVATPLTTTTYTVVADIGSCSTQGSITVKVVPAPVADAGPNQTICFGFDTQLNASGGSSYSWTPPLFLDNPSIASPNVIQPRRTMQYIVTVTDTLGCPTPVNDTVLVTVIPALNVNAGPADTSVVEDEPLQLNGTGALTYTWSPSTWLTATNIANPISNPLDTIRYFLTGMDANGCSGTDSIDVYVFRVEEDMYVPTAFTPNGDGLNDTFKPLMLGMKSLAYFRVYNRFGELVFSTSQIDHGWDGIFKGKPQGTATFVWYAAGITYKGQLKKKKGYVVLIR